MPNGTYGGVRGRKTKVGRKLSFSSYSINILSIHFIASYEPWRRTKCGFSQRNLIISSLSLSIGIGFTQASGLFNIFPELVKTVFAENCVAVVFIIAVILNLTLKKE